MRTKLTGPLSSAEPIAPPDPDRTDWRDVAVCASVDPNLFYPVQGEQPTAAKLVCAGCPVRAECLTDAWASPESEGVWGGLTKRERQSARGAGLTAAQATAAGPTLTARALRALWARL